MAAYLQAFRQNGMVEGVDYDTYTTKGSGSSVSNGLGSAGYHGANAGQLDGYDCIIYSLWILDQHLDLRWNWGQWQ